MYRRLALLLVLPVALGPSVIPAQTKTTIRITIGSDGTCLAAGLHVPCRDVGAKLREVGVPADAYIQFSGDGEAGQDVIRATMDSVTAAGYEITKIGFITVPRR
jgi:hypothetical protein